MAARVTYIGNVNFEQAAGPVWSRDFYGFDTARIPWQGAATKLKAFEDSLREFTAMPGYSRMFLTGWSNNDEKVFPTVDLHYIGFRGNTAPREKIEDGTALSSISTNVIPTAGALEGVQVSLEATYLASRTTYTWLTYTKPEPISKFRTCRNRVDPLNTIQTWRVSGEGTESGVDTAAFTQLINSIGRQEVVSDYTVEDIVPDKLWACRACVDYILTGA